MWASKTNERQRGTRATLLGERRGLEGYGSEEKKKEKESELLFIVGTWLASRRCREVVEPRMGLARAVIAEPGA